MRKRRGERPECADCLIDTIDIYEFYMVKDEVWSYAWRTWRPPPPTLAPLGFELPYPAAAREWMAVGPKRIQASSTAGAQGLEPAGRSFPFPEWLRRPVARPHSVLAARILTGPQVAAVFPLWGGDRR
jgi:hypothetical protein